MDITNILNGKGPAAVAAAAERQFQHHMTQGVSYNPVPQLQQQMPMLPTNYVERPFQNIIMQQQQPNDQRENGPDDSGSSRQNSNGSVKAFACNTCGKGFARRSDLARHGKVTRNSPSLALLIHLIERIHSGDRPHVCPERGCNKPFIQRSALTVHMRVHSGEKPHMCERCGKVRNYNVLKYTALTTFIALQRFELSSPTSSYTLWKTAIQMPLCRLSKDLHPSHYSDSSPKPTLWHSGRGSGRDCCSSCLPQPWTAQPCRLGSRGFF